MIDFKINEYKQAAQESILNYKNAYISTGGTEDEFAAKNIEIMVNYKLKCNNETYSSFVLEMYESWTSSTAEYEYYNFDSNTGDILSLKDLLGDDYIAIANNSINTAILNAENQEMYFTIDQGGFETISDSTNFYINEHSNPLIVFDKYEIAAGALGSPTFEIHVPK